MQARTQSFNMDFIWCCEDCLLCESFAPPNERDLVGFSCVCFVSRKLESMDSKPPGLRRMRSICEALVALEDIWSSERGSSMVGLLNKKGNVAKRRKICHAECCVSQQASSMGLYSEDFFSTTNKSLLCCSVILILASAVLILR